MATYVRLVSHLSTTAMADAIFPIFYIFLPLFAAELGADPVELGLVGERHTPCTRLSPS